MLDCMSICQNNKIEFVDSAIILNTLMNYKFDTDKPIELVELTNYDDTPRGDTIGDLCVKLDTIHKFGRMHLTTFDLYLGFKDTKYPELLLVYHDSKRIFSELNWDTLNKYNFYADFNHALKTTIDIKNTISVNLTVYLNNLTKNG